MIIFRYVLLVGAMALWIPLDARTIEQPRPMLPGIQYPQKDASWMYLNHCRDKTAKKCSYKMKSFANIQVASNGAA